MEMKYKFGVIIFICLSIGLNAQQHRLKMVFDEANYDETWLKSNFAWDPEKPVDTLAQNALENLLQKLHEAGYLEASIDHIEIKDSSLTEAKLFIGPQYQWTFLSPGNIRSDWLNKAGYREKLFRGKLFSIEELVELKQALLTIAENDGFPFAKIDLQRLEVRDGQISAALNLERDSLILFDELKIEGTLNISLQYLTKYLGILPDQPYSREQVLKIKDRLKELPFLDSASDPVVQFSDNRAIVTLNLKKKRSSKFDFIIGVLPNTDGRLRITGDFKGELYNQFGQGERIFASFEQLKPGSQQLNIQANYPYLPQMPFGLDATFDLFKQDSSFVDLRYDLGVQYQMEGGDYVKVFWRNQQSNLLAINTQRIIQSGRLPETLDFQYATFGLAWLKQKLDYRLNPRMGWSVFIEGGAGRKQVKPNPKILELPVGGLYDSIPLRTFQYRFEADLAAYVPLFSRSTIKLGFRGGWVASANPIYQNEQFRIGGNRLLRGFTEQSIFATRFGVLTGEYRFLIGQNSYLSTFIDGAYVEDETNERRIIDQKLGFGAGITFETNVGLFSLSMAYGRSSLAPALDFGAPKVHFGYVNLF